MYKSLDKKSIKVMRINALLSSAIILIILTVICVAVFKSDAESSVLIPVFSVSGIIAIAALLDIVLFPKIRYSRYKYLVTEEKVEVKKGLFLITRSIIQIKRIQKIELNSGPIDRLFNLSNVNIYTAAGVVDIKFLNNDEAETIVTKVNDLLKHKLETENEN